MLSQFFSHPAAAGAGPDYNGIVNLHHASLSAGDSLDQPAQPTLSILVARRLSILCQALAL
jgi:hypothetical protein